MSKKEVSVLIDDREPSEFISEVAAHEEVRDWEADRLEIGDLKFEEADLLIERKTPGDYNSSLTSGHLKSQIERMKQVTDNSYILVEGDLRDFEDMEYSGIPATAIRGSVASIMARDDVPIVPCSDRESLIDISVRLARKYIEEPGRGMMDSGPIDVGEPFAKRVYGLIGGIGRDTAETVHSRYQTIPEAQEASISELCELDGIGNKTAEKIKDHLNGDI